MKRGQDWFDFLIFKIELNFLFGVEVKLDLLTRIVNLRGKRTGNCKRNRKENILLGLCLRSSKPERALRTNLQWPVRHRELLNLLPFVTRFYRLNRSKFGPRIFPIPRFTFPKILGAKIPSSKCIKNLINMFWHPLPSVFNVINAKKSKNSFREDTAQNFNISLRNFMNVPWLGYFKNEYFIKTT